MTKPRPRWMIALVAGGILLAVCSSPARSQPGLAGSGSAGPSKSEPRARVDHEGIPLPAEAITRIGSARMRTHAAIVWLSYSLDGKTIVSASGDRVSQNGKIQFWDAATGKLRTEKSAKMGAASAGMAMRPDGKILHLDGDGFYRVLSAADGNEISQVRLALAEMPSDVWLAACFSPRGNLLAVRSASDQVRLFDLVEQKEQPPLKLHARPPGGGVIVGQTLAFTPDGTTLAVASEDNRVETFDVANGFKKGIEFEVPTKHVIHLDFSPDGKDLFCGSYTPGAVILRDWIGRKEPVRLDKTAPTGSAFSPDGRRLAVASWRDSVTLFEVATGKREHQFSAGRLSPLVSFSHDGRTLLTASAECAIGQWDTTTGRPLPASADPPGDFSLLRFTPDAKHLMAYTDRHVLFDSASGRLLRPCAAAESDYPFQATLSDDGAILAVPRQKELLQSKELLLIDAHTAKELRRLDANGAYMNRPTFLGNRLFVPCSDRVMRVWDANGIGTSRSLKDTDPVSGTWWISTRGEYVALAPRGDRTESNQDIRLWGVEAGKIVRRVASPRQGTFSVSLAFSTDGRLLAIMGAAFNGKSKPDLKVVDLWTGKATPFSATIPTVGPLAFSPDGRTLVTGDFDGEGVRLWEVATGKERWQFRGHKTRISSLVWSADGAWLASASSEAPAYIWDVYGKQANDRPAAAAWTAGHKQKCWDDLLMPEAKAGFEAIRALVQSPEAALELVGPRLKPAESVNEKTLQQLLRDLDSDDFDARQYAFVEMKKLGDRIEGPLLHTLKNPPSLEAQRRLQALLENAEVLLPEGLAQRRALEALEQMATPEAVRLLEALVAGEPGARLTQEATSTLRRVRQRPK